MFVCLKQCEDYKLLDCNVTCAVISRSALPLQHCFVLKFECSGCQAYTKISSRISHHFYGYCQADASRQLNSQMGTWTPWRLSCLLPSSSGFAFFSLSVEKQHGNTKVASLYVHSNASILTFLLYLLACWKGTSNGTGTIKTSLF